MKKRFKKILSILSAILLLVVFIATSADIMLAYSIKFFGIPLIGILGLLAAIITLLYGEENTSFFAISLIGLWVGYCLMTVNRHPANHYLSINIISPVIMTISLSGLATALVGKQKRKK
jgi:hypothetical protein